MANLDQNAKIANNAKTTVQDVKIAKTIVQDVKNDTNSVMTATSIAQQHHQTTTLPLHLQTTTIALRP